MRHRFLKPAWLLLGCWGVLLPPAALSADLEARFAFDRRPPNLAVIVLEGAPLRSPQAEVNQANKQFTPELVLVPPGGELLIRNSDEVNHNVYADDAKQNVQFDIGLREPGRLDRLKATWPEGSLFRLSCKIHSNMRGWVAVVSSRQAEVISFDPRLRGKTQTLTGVPTQLQRLRIQLPGLDPVKVNLKTDLGKEIPLVKLGTRIGGVVLAWSQPGGL